MVLCRIFVCTRGHHVASKVPADAAGASLVGEGRENHNRLPVARNIVWGLITPSIRPRRRVLGGELGAPATAITTEFQLILEHILGGCATNEIHDGLRWEVQRPEGMHWSWTQEQWSMAWVPLLNEVPVRRKNRRIWAIGELRRFDLQECGSHHQIITYPYMRCVVPKWPHKDPGGGHTYTTTRREPIGNSREVSHDHPI